MISIIVAAALTSTAKPNLPNPCFGNDIAIISRQKFTSARPVSGDVSPYVRGFTIYHDIIDGTPDGPSPLTVRYPKGMRFCIMSSEFRCHSAGLSIHDTGTELTFCRKN